MTKKRMGRPPKPPAEKASARITVHCTQEQRAIWSELAGFEGLSLSAWLADRADRDTAISRVTDHARGYRDGVKDSAAIVLELLK